MKNHFILLLLFTLFYGVCPAQVYNFLNPQPGRMVCVWSESPVFSEPDKRAAIVAVMQFGEEASSLGEEAYVALEKNNYLKVRGADGKVGWVNEFLFVPEGGAAVVLAEGRVYRRPNTISTVTMDFFLPGEIVIMEDVVGQWVKLVSRNREKTGWIEGLEKVSVEPADIELATLMHRVDEEPSSAMRKTLLEELLALAGNSRTEMYDLILARYEGETKNNRTLADLGQSTTGTRTRSLEAATSSGEGVYRSAGTEEVFDPKTGKMRTRITETGKVYEVLGPQNPRTIYFAYHKTLPIGSKIQLHFPDNSGFVELEIVNRLRKDNPAIIGLSRACLQTVFGRTDPGEAIIEYLR
ncbi:MAG: SH3 domain-containing protein [Bacteroidia bacterium]